MSPVQNQVFKTAGACGAAKEGGQATVILDMVWKKQNGILENQYGWPIFLSAFGRNHFPGGVWKSGEVGTVS